MAQIIKVSNGETIQIRTGVLQGIGPQGPTGPTGATGAQGQQGPQGEKGDMGQILEFNSELKVLTPNTIAPDATTVVTFDSTVRDELGVVFSATTLKATTQVDLFFMVWVQFDAPVNANSWFHVELFSSEGGVFSADSVVQSGDSTHPVDLNMTATKRLVANETVQVRVRHSDGVINHQIAAGSRLAAYRVGSGPYGPTGAAGSVGPQGPTGPQGAQGPAGNASTGYGSYAGLIAP